MIRALKGIDDVITVSVVHHLMLEHGWTFAPSKLGVKDDLYGLNYLYELYLKADPNYSGRVTLPVLWDKQKETIVSNESADIIRMLNTSFKDFKKNAPDYYPAELAAEFDDINNFVYNNINNRKVGFATEQTV